VRLLPNAGKVWSAVLEVWPEAQRKLWLDTAASIFKMIYKDKNREVDWTNPKMIRSEAV
jgi:hypothetical protein